VGAQGRTVMWAFRHTCKVVVGNLSSLLSSISSNIKAQYEQKIVEEYMDIHLVHFVYAGYTVCLLVPEANVMFF
jgi:hypothetical protein